MLPLLCPDDKGCKRFDCDDCPRDLDEVTRRGLHCGLLPERDWTDGGMPKSLGTAGYKADVDQRGPCPGHLGRLPGVIESAQGYAAFKVGELSQVFPDPDQAVVEGVLALQSAFSRYESAQLKERP